MRIHRKLQAIATLVVVNASVLIACVGGAGGTSGGLETWEQAPPSQDRAQTTGREPAPSTVDRVGADQRGFNPAPGAQGVGGPGAQQGSSGSVGGGFDCAGIYVCQESGKTKTDTVLVATVNGKCVAEGLTLEADGRITKNGKQAGTWAQSGTGFTVVTEDGLVTCTKAAIGSSSSSSSGANPTPTATVNPRPLPVVDAGGR